MSRVARTPAEVVAGEAAYGTRAERYADMLGIASVISNRSTALGVTPEQVVGVRREFNAFGKGLPAGAAAYVGLAQAALDAVALHGPVNNATFYATPAAKANLPKGLVKEAETTGHVYFSDPKNRAIGTAVGYRQPDPRAIAAAPAPANVPAPQFAVRDVGGLLAPASVAPAAMSLAASPVASPSQAALASALAPSRVGLSPAKEANLASRLAPAPAFNPKVSTPTTINAPPSQRSEPMTTAKEARLASQLGVSVNGTKPGSAPLSAAKEANLASRLGPSTAMSAAKAANVTSRLDAAQGPSFASTPSVSLGGLLGVSPAGAATLASAARQTPSVSAPKASTGFAGSVGSPRSMDATIAGPQAANRMSPAPSSPALAPSQPAARAAPAAGNFAGAAGSPRAAQEQSMAALNAANALGAGMFTGAPAKPSAPVATPSLSPEAALAADVADQRKSLGLPALSAPVSVSAPPKTYNAPAAKPQPEMPSVTTRAPQNVVGAVGQTRTPEPTGLGLPSVPAAPSGLAQARSQVGNYMSNNAGGLLGGMLGAAALGPIGGLLGSWAGRSIQGANTTQASPLAQALGKAGLLGGLIDGGIGYGSTGLGLPGIPNAPTGQPNYSMDGGGPAPSEAARAAARDYGFDGFGYSGLTSGGSRGGGIGPGGGGARSPG